MITASDKNEAIEQLLNSGLTVLELNPEEDANQAESVWQKDLGSKDIHKVKVSKKVLLSMLNQMSLMMKAGVSLTLAMDVMIDSQKDKKFKKILQEIKKDLLSGTTISASMAKFRAFPELIISMVQSGEENGRLDTAFERCTSILEKEMLLTSKIRGAMIYPIILLCLTVALMIILNVIVLPNFASVFKQFGADLPALTKGVIAVSNFLMTRWYVVIAVIFLILFSYKFARRTSKEFLLKTDSLKLKFPLIGEVTRQSLTARFCRVMASLVEAGVDVVHSLKISRDIVSNHLIQMQLDQIMEDVKVGIAINVSMSRFPTFDTLLVSMIRAGEESGMLGDSLKKMADLYEQQTEESTKRMTSLMEPIMTVIIAVLVGTVIISIVMPMFGMYSVISKG